MNINEILEENGRRVAAVSVPYDPVRGKKTENGRVKAFTPDGELCYLPEAMTRDPLFITKDEKIFHRLRCLYDFPYWAATCVYIKSKKVVPISRSYLTVLKESLWPNSRRCVP